MLKNLSPKQSEIFKENEEECLENTVVKYHSSRYYFHVLISDSFYSLYLDLFLDSSGLILYPRYLTLCHHNQIFSIWQNLVKLIPSITLIKLDLMLFHLHHSNGKRTCCKMILHDLFLKNKMHSFLWRSNILHCIFVLWLV
jgi:hypothetical protein